MTDVANRPKLRHPTPRYVRDAAGVGRPTAPATPVWSKIAAGLMGAVVIVAIVVLLWLLVSSLSRSGTAEVGYQPQPAGGSVTSLDSPAVAVTNETAQADDGDTATLAASAAVVELPATPNVTASGVEGAVAPFATRFAVAYLNYDAEDADSYRRRLTMFLPGDADLVSFWDGNGTQRTGTVVATGVEGGQGDGWDVTISAEVTGIEQPRQIALRVPVSVSDDGRLYVPHAPARIPLEDAPTSARPDGAVPAPEMAGSFEEFFAAFATGDLTGLAADDVVGLDGTVQLIDVVDVLRLAGGTYRTSVRWGDLATTATILQVYNVTVDAAGTITDVS